MNTEFDQLRETLLATCRSGPVFYLPNLGNWGDGLIRAGTLRFLQQAGIGFTEIEHVSRAERWLPWKRKGTLIYGGGGAWSSLWSHSFRTIKRVGHLFERVVVLPSSFELRVSLPRVILYCRDRFESQVNAPAAHFCHDMAFFLGQQSAPSGSGVGWFLRTDAESAHGLPIPEGNVDLSQLGSHLTPVEPFFQALAKYAVIHTDRLHVAIASCLLGRELHLYPGAYFKNRAVFQSSIEGRFPRVHFHDTKA
ncbi:MAG TPA: polysaccharide pyruvyl transferase family protein [Gemmatimonadales bacterium]|nr:polysaccharide pyruvyl transferase family protein [Gemmatimonadales bacterium]